MALNVFDGIEYMKKTLIETNPYLKDPNQREKLVRRSVRTSCAVEGIAPKLENTSTIEIKHRTPKKIYKKSR